MICTFLTWLVVAIAAGIGFQGYLFQKAASWGKIDVGLWTATWVALVAAIVEGLFEIAFTLAWFGVPPDLVAMRTSWMPAVGSVIGFLMFIGVVALFLQLDVWESALLGVRFILIQWALLFALVGIVIVGGVFTGVFAQFYAGAVIHQVTTQPNPPSNSPFQPVSP